LFQLEAGHCQEITDLSSELLTEKMAFYGIEMPTSEEGWIEGEHAERGLILHYTDTWQIEPVDVPGPLY